MMGFGRGWGMGYGIFGTGGGIFMIAFWAVIIIGIIYLVRNLNNNKNNNYSSRDNNYRQEDNAAEIARERYARGEITKEELNEILNNLSNYNI